jgi:diaminopimelate epimerase
MALPFFKYEGLGNDFLVIERDALGGAELSTERAVALCDRHRGVGADGVLVVDVNVPRMDVINADGSIPEMCGNGIRCVALHLARRAGLERLDVTIHTRSGPHACTVVNRPGEETVEVEMAQPSLEPRDLPLNAQQPWLDRALEVDGRELRLTGVSMGNPHAVTFDDVGLERMELGPHVQADPHFPEGVNVGFVSELDGESMRLDVLERGAGWTQACGTGACAAAVAAVETGRAERSRALRVRLPGGALDVTVGADGAPILMKGPARYVFSGQLPS